jgi:hypothetical protein
MSSNSKLDATRRSTLATLDEIRAGEASLKSQGIDATDLGDWMQLRDIMARIERRMMASMKETA